MVQKSPYFSICEKKWTERGSEWKNFERKSWFFAGFLIYLV